jgi:subtilisin family serine protease
VNSNSLTLCRVAPLLAWLRGDPDVVIGLVDGPVAIDHPGLEPCQVHGMTLPVRWCQGGCPGTFVAGVLVGRRDSSAPALCPGCTLVSRPVRGDVADDGGDVEASPDQIAAAIEDCLEAGARIVNVSVVLPPAAAEGSAALTAVLDRAARRGVLLVVAAGPAPRGSALSLHPWVVPVAACTATGVPLPSAQLGPRLARRTLLAPGEHITSLDGRGGLVIRSGAAAAVPFVSGTAALLWSALPDTGVDALRHALLCTAHGSPVTSTPRLLDAWAAYAHLRGLAAGHL